MAALGRGGLDEIVDQSQHVLFVPQVAERIIAIALLQVDKIQHTDVITLAFEVAACGQQDFGFGVRDHIIDVADIPGEQLVLLLSEHGVDLLGRGPGSGAVFLAVPRPALLVCVEADAHDVGPGAGQDGHEAVFRPLDAEGVFHRRRQVADDLRQTAAQGLGDE